MTRTRIMSEKEVRGRYLQTTAVANTNLPASPEKLTWHTSARGNPYALADGFHVVVFGRQTGQWSVRIEEVETGRDWYPAGRFADQNEARAVAFHALQQILSGDHSVPAGNWIAGGPRTDWSRPSQ